METNIILEGDVLARLKELPDESVDCIITSPPYYGLRDYQTAKWEGGIIECDHLISKLTSAKSTLHDIPEKKKMLTGIPYKSICGKCGAKRIDFQIGLEENIDEYINRLLLVTAELKRVLKKSGVMFWNHGDSYGGSGNSSGHNENTLNLGKNTQMYGASKGNQKNTKGMEKCLLLQAYRLVIKMIDEQGWILRNQIIWHKPNCMPSSVKDRFTVDFEPVFFFSKSKRYYFVAQREPHLTPNWKSKPRRKVRENWVGINVGNSQDKAGGYHPLGRMKRCVWKISTTPFNDAHFATFPSRLIEPMIRAGCPVGGIVLDPFFGAGTTGLVACILGRRWIGIELNPNYVIIAKKRLKPILLQKRLIPLSKNIEVQ